MSPLVRVVFGLVKMLVRLDQQKRKKAAKPPAAQGYQRRDTTVSHLTQHLKQTRADAASESVSRGVPRAPVSSERPEAKQKAPGSVADTSPSGPRLVVEPWQQAAARSRAEKAAQGTPPANAAIDTLEARLKQGDAQAYFELVELYADAKNRQRVQAIITDPEVVATERERWDAWEELEKTDPARCVRVRLLNMVIRGCSRTDPRDDWMAIELTAQYAKGHGVDTAAILDEVTAMSGDMASEIRLRRYLFEE